MQTAVREVPQARWAREGTHSLPLLWWIKCALPTVGLWAAVLPSPASSLLLGYSHHFFHCCDSSSKNTLTPPLRFLFSKCLQRALMLTVCLSHYLPTPLPSDVQSHFFPWNCSCKDHQWPLLNFMVLRSSVSCLIWYCSFPLSVKTTLLVCPNTAVL